MPNPEVINKAALQRARVLVGALVLAAGATAISLISLRESPPRLRAGDPILQSAAIPLAGMLAETRPVAADGEFVLLEHEDDSRIEYEWWNPSTAAIMPLAGLARNPGVTYVPVNLVGTSVLLWETDFSGPAANLVLHNLQTGEDRLVATDALPGAGGNSEHIVWATVDGKVSLLSLVDSFLTSITPEGSGHLLSVAIEGNRVALLESDSSGEDSVMIRELDSNNTRNIDVPAAAGPIALSGEADYLFWAQDTGAQRGFFARKVNKGKTVQFLNDGIGLGSRGLSIRGDCVSWQPAPGSNVAQAGYYNASTGTVRFVARSLARPTFSAIMGYWFVWGESTGDIATYYVTSLSGEPGCQHATPTSVEEPPFRGFALRRGASLGSLLWFLLLGTFLLAYLPSPPAVLQCPRTPPSKQNVGESS